MLLGAWTSKPDCRRVLDIGTGTGILALMMAQKHPNASITAIEQDLPSLQEAMLNFRNSSFSDRIMGVHTPLQQFGAMELFDLIICNPPYFDSQYLSQDEQRNRARHNQTLEIFELYDFSSDLLTDDGLLSVIFPSSTEREHFERAFDAELYPLKVMRTLTPSGEFKRTLVLFSKEETDITDEKTIRIKDEKNNYSSEYIELTKDFYQKSL